MSISLAATQAIIDDLNEMLGLCGDLPIASLQTDTNTVAGRAERVYQAARRRILGQDWHANTQILDIEKDGNNRYTAPDSILTIRPTNPIYNVVLRAGMLYDLDEDTNQWPNGPATMECRCVFDYYPDRLPPMLRRAILTQAAHDYLLGQKQGGGSVMDTRLYQQARDAHAEALRENSEKLGLNMLDTDHAWKVRGDRPFLPRRSTDGSNW